MFYANGLSGDSQLAVYDLATQQRTDLLPGTTPSCAATGHLVFWRDGSLWAVPFDPDRLEVEGSPVLVVEGVSSHGFGEMAAYSLAHNGTLAYLPASGSKPTLVWVNREGHQAPIDGVDPDR